MGRLPAESGDRRLSDCERWTLAQALEGWPPPAHLFTAAELADSLIAYSSGRWSWHGIRNAVGALRDLGLLDVVAEDSRTGTGRRAKVYRVSAAGRRRLQTPEQPRST